MDKFWQSFRDSGIVWLLGVAVAIGAYTATTINGISFQVALISNNLAKTDHAVEELAKKYDKSDRDSAVDSKGVADDINQLKTASVDHETRIKTLEMKAK